MLTLLSVPFWILGLLPLPGLTAGLPVSAVVAVCPAVAVALLLSDSKPRRNWWRQRLRALVPESRSGRTALLYALLMPTVVLLAAVLHGARWARLLEPLHWLHAVTLVVPLLAAAITEEVGWTAWLLPRLCPVWGRLRAGIVIGLTWGVWHAVPYFQAGNPIDWVVGQVLFSLVFRVLIVEATSGMPSELLLAVLLHATYNAAWQVVIASGSTYSPWITAAVTAVCLAVIFRVRQPNFGRLPPRQT